MNSNTGALVIATALLISGGSTSGSAATYLIEFESHDFTAFNAGPAPINSLTGSVTLTLDLPSVMVLDVTSGTTLNSLSFVPSSQLSFSYFPFFDELHIGGILATTSALATGANDFLLKIDSFSTSPVFLSLTYTHTSDADGAWFTETGSVAVTETPIPAALPLFATGLAGLGLFAHYRTRKRSA